MGGGPRKGGQAPNGGPFSSLCVSLIFPQRLCVELKRPFSPCRSGLFEPWVPITSVPHARVGIPAPSPIRSRNNVRPSPFACEEPFLGSGNQSPGTGLLQ